MIIRDADRQDFADGWEKIGRSLAASRLSADGAALLVAEHDGRINRSVAYYPPGRSHSTIFPDLS
jgi:hypothetical protein